jgi:hypothetical protein
MKKKSRESGVVLLLMLMVLAILIVVVGQFSTTAVLDWQIARNRHREVQFSLDVRTGVEAAKAALSARGENEEGDLSLSVGREDATVEVRIRDESGKFNVNSLVRPPKGVTPDRAETALRRLLDLADHPPGTLPAGTAEGIVTLVKGAEKPLPTLASLLAVEGVTAEVLWGAPEADEENADWGGGLARLLTVHGDGRIRPGAGDDRVLLALSSKLTPAVLNMALAYVRNPTGNPSPQVAQLAQDLLPWTTWESQAYAATVEARRDENGRRARVVLGAGEGAWTVIRYDELE